MSHRKLFLGVAVAALMGACSPAMAQQYFSKYKENDRPAVEIDMSVLGDGPTASEAPAVTQEPLPADHPSSKVKVADFGYSRAPALGGSDAQQQAAPEEAPAPAPEPEAQVVAPVAAVPPAPAAEAPVKKTKKEHPASPATEAPEATSSSVTDKLNKMQAVPATAPKVEKTEEKKKPPAHHPSLIITDAPAPEAAKHTAPVPAPAPASAPGAIISKPPEGASPAEAAPHRDLNKAAPIISNPPDSDLPAVTEGAPAAHAVAAPPIEMPPEVPATPEAPPAEMHKKLNDAAPIISHPPDSKKALSESLPVPAAAMAPVAPPAKLKKARTKTHAPAPAIVSTPEPAPAPAIVSMPEPKPAAPAVAEENRPAPAPFHDITVVHEADNPLVMEAPEPAPPPPREEPLPLPKSKKLSKKARSEPPPLPGNLMTEPVKPYSPPAAKQAKSAPEPVAPQPAPAAAPAPAPDVAVTTPPPAPPAEPSMPAVPTIADLMLGFEGNSSDLTTEGQKKLDAVARQLKDMTDGRLQVRGFATGEDGSKSSARRIALSRALSVRSYLMDRGIKPTRIDVRAMGAETDRSPLDRVDLVFVR